MPDVISKLMKINIRARSRERIETLLRDVLGGTAGWNRGANTIGDFEGAFFNVGGVTFDVMVPNDPDGALAKVMDKHGEGIDSICFSVDDMDYTQAELAKHGVEFSHRQEFRGNQVAFVSRKDACGISLEFIQGAATEGATRET
jgi:methylmalonyl-CoA/ethylmalonyl-CoA epimerase